MRATAQHEPRRQGLHYRQALYFLNRLRGMNRRQAALDAGYKELTANNARQVIEGHGLKRVSLMRELCQTIGREEEGYSTASGTEKSTVLVRPNRSPNLDHSYDFEEPHLTPEGPSPLELAEDLIEGLSIPTDLLCQVSNCIETKARANGISFAAAHDEIRKAAHDHPPPDGRWALWFLNGGYDYRQLSKTRHT